MAHEDYLLSWQPEYSVHIEAIDAQHQVLVGMIRQLQEAMEEGRGRAFQGTLIAQLAAYTQVHFQFEEELMGARQYEGLAEHIAQHRTLTGQVCALQERVSEGQVVSNAALMLFLRNWLTDHIMQHDQKYASAFSKGNHR